MVIVCDMAKKKGSGKKKKGSGKKGAKGKDDKKAPPRKTRCGPDFKWQAQPKLVEAVNANNVNRAKKLMANGEDANEALHHAIGRGKISIVKAMLEAGADIHTEIKV